MKINKYFSKLRKLFDTFDADTKTDTSISNIYVGNTKTFDDANNDHMFYIIVERSDNSTTTYIYRYNSTNNKAVIIDTIDAYFKKYVDDADDVKYKFTQLSIVNYMLVNNI